MARAPFANLAIVLCVASAWPNVARADEAASEPPPPSLSRRYLQVGVAFTGEFVASAGGICSSVTAPCILGSGGGIAARAGIRRVGPTYVGLAYEFSKQDPAQLYRLAILQQLRVEGRMYFFDTKTATQPYLVGGVGVAGYGNEWGVDTGGPLASLGLGTETQISRSTVLGIALSWRAIYTARFRDGAGATRSDGVAQLFGIDLVLEGRDPF